MRILEEPFLTREAILAVLKPGQITSDRPFDTLRKRGGASPGRQLHLRLERGQLGGTLYLYSALNLDAARAYRLREHDLARKLAGQSRKIESSPAAQLIIDAIGRGAAETYRVRLARDAPEELRRYVQMRRGHGKGLTESALARDWVIRSRSWLTADSPRHDELIDAVETLRLKAEGVRAKLLAPDAFSATTFLGFVVRLDSVSAELESEAGEVMHLPRRDLEREGLAMLGQPVCLLQESLPAGGSYVFPMPAVAVEAPSFGDAPSPWGSEFAEGSLLIRKLKPRDTAWVEQQLGRKPNVIAATATKVG